MHACMPNIDTKITGMMLYGIMHNAKALKVDLHIWTHLRSPYLILIAKFISTLDGKKGKKR